jgi:hypothetical protein
VQTGDFGRLSLLAAIVKERSLKARALHRLDLPGKFNSFAEDVKPELSKISLG